MFTINGLVNFVALLVVGGLIVSLLLWLVNNPEVGIPDPFKHVIKVAVYVSSVFILIYAILNLAGMAPPLIRWDNQVVRP